MKKADQQRKIVAIVDPKQIILKGGNYTLERHKIYSQKLINVAKNYELQIFYPITKNKDLSPNKKNYPFMIGIPCPDVFNKTYFLFKLILKIRKQESRLHMLVAGDPWFAFLNCYLIKLLSNKNLLIQTQLHADLGSDSWRKSSIKNRIKFEIAKIALKYSDSIRCVSKYQKNQLIKHFHISNNKVFVSGVIFPLPKSVSSRKNKKNKDGIISIGFFGRIEEDRGVKDFILLLRKIKDLDTNFRIVVAGNGSLTKYLLGELRKIIPDGNILFLGMLDSAKLSLFFNKIDFCVFTAKSESFGRGMRECLANKVPVWSNPTSGFLDLKDICIDDGVLKNLEEINDQSSLMGALNEVKTIKFNTDYTKLFGKIADKDLMNLIDSWLIERVRK